MFPIAITGLDESFELLYSVSDYFLSDPVVLIIVGVLVAGNSYRKQLNHALTPEQTKDNADQSAGNKCKEKNTENRIFGYKGKSTRNSIEGIS